MIATDILSAEHRVIEQVLACLDKLSDLDDAQVFPVTPAGEILDFFKNFADRCHHGKEEVHLVPAMEENGFSATQGPTAVMRSEHEQGRLYIEAMSKALEMLRSDTNNRESRQHFRRSAKDYIRLLGDHIFKEDTVLFPMAENCLSNREKDELVSEFTRVEKDIMGEGTHESYLKLADRLAGFFGVEKTGCPRSVASFGCKH